MNALFQFAPHFSLMALLIVASGFFSCSEAALFYLGRDERERMASSGPGARAAVRLLERPERLLTAILFWNLVINIAYFALASVVALRLEAQGERPLATGVAVGSLLVIIVISEMAPKNLGVLWSGPLAAAVSMPLSASTRTLDPVIPALEAIHRVSSRLLLPKLAPEAYLELRDLERAISISTSDQALVEQERAVLSRIVALSETRVEELMRPRRLYESFHPPLNFAEIEGRETPSGFVLITEPDSDEIALAIERDQLALLNETDQMERHATPVAPIPWCATAAKALDELDSRPAQVATVLNELGETLGIVTRDDLLNAVLQRDPTQHAPCRSKVWLSEREDGSWELGGRTTLRQLARRLGRTFPATKSITIAGMLQEQLKRLPENGDQIVWGHLRWTIVDATDPGALIALVGPVSPEDLSANDKTDDASSEASTSEN